MSLPKLTAKIGKSSSNVELNEFSSIIKDVKKPKENEQQYIVFIIFDLIKEEIYFKLNEKLTEDSAYKYYYFGNNSAASFQYYLTREGQSIKYLLGSTLSDLYQMLSKNKIGKEELKNIIKRVEDKKMIFLEDKKGEGKINFNKLSIIVNGKVKKVSLDEKSNSVIDGKRYNIDEFIRLFIDDQNKHNKFVLIVPKIILENNEELIPSTHEEYLELVRISNRLGNSQEEEIGSGRICYICNKRSSTVSSDYSKKLSRTGINKIFTTTTINTSPYLQKFDYDNAYSMCNDCYQDLLAGEKKISEQFKSKIAGEDAFILPQGILGSFDYQYLKTLKRNIDLSFSSIDTEKWIKEIETENEECNVNQYSISFIIYRTDGNSVTVQQTIEDIPTLRFEKIMKILDSCTEDLNPYININISIGSIYGLIPVKVNKSGEQLDIGRVLSLYKSIFCGERINHKILYAYAMEGLDSGLKQLSKLRIDNYYNMNLIKYQNGREDFFIKRIVFGYITLIKACQKLELLDKEVYKSSKKEDETLNTINAKSGKDNSLVLSIEGFLDKQGFDNEERALFYLGILLNKVALAQYRKDHKTKPILKKIQFQGMNEKEVNILYQEIVEKLMQYDEMKPSNEVIMNRFHYYFGSLKKPWTLNDYANVFYIMAGYSYMVGRRSENADTTEEKIEDEGFEDENNE